MGEIYRLHQHYRDAVHSPVNIVARIEAVRYAGIDHGGGGALYTLECVTTPFLSGDKTISRFTATISGEAIPKDLQVRLFDTRTALPLVLVGGMIDQQGIFQLSSIDPYAPPAVDGHSKVVRLIPREDQGVQPPCDV